MNQLTLIQRLAVWIVPAVLAIVIHEVAHAWMAHRLGDDTAKRSGRLTLNPLPHIDPIGTLLLPGLLIALGGVVFGWAKPVPVDWGSLKNPRRDIALVAGAGPFANLIMGIGWAMLAHAADALMPIVPDVGEPLSYMAIVGVFINMVLLVINLIPMLPLDGGRIAVSFLPVPLATSLYKLEKYGAILVLLLLVSGLLTQWISPLVYALTHLFLGN